MSSNMSDPIPRSTRTGEYNKGVLLGVIPSMLALTLVVVGARFYTRWRFKIAYGWDDWTILASLILCIGVAVTVIISASIGDLGSHQKLGPNNELIHYPGLYHFEKCRYTADLLSTINLGVVKMSILFFYRRLFVVRPFQIASLIMMVFVIMWTMAFSGVMAGPCVPLHIFWDDFEIDYGNRCIQVQALYEALAWSDLALDLIILMSPLPVIYFLHMPWEKKIAVADGLLLNIIVIGSGIGRIVSFMTVIRVTDESPYTFFYDSTWWTAGPLFWAFAEGSIAIIGACLPTLAPLWRHLTKSKYSHTNATTNLSKKSHDDSMADSQFRSRNRDSVRTEPTSRPRSEALSGDTELGSLEDQRTSTLTSQLRHPLGGGGERGSAVGSATTGGRLSEGIYVEQSWSVERDENEMRLPGIGRSSL